MKNFSRYSFKTKMNFFKALLLCLLIKSIESWNFNLIKSHMNEYQLTLANFFCCNGIDGNFLELTFLIFTNCLFIFLISENYDWMKRVNEEFFFSSFVDLSNEENLEEFRLKSLFRNENRVKAIFVDIDCNETAELFEEVSKYNFFNRSYNWMMFGSDYLNAVDLLQNQNINIDAEVTLAVEDDM